MNSTEMHFSMSRSQRLGGVNACSHTAKVRFQMHSMHQHVDLAQLHQDDINGDTINVAARLEALAEPGGIRISDTAHKHV